MERKPRMGSGKSFSILWISCQKINPSAPTPASVPNTRGPPTNSAASWFFLVLAKTANLFNTASEAVEHLPGESGKPGDRHVPKRRAAQGGGVGTGFIHLYGSKQFQASANDYYDSDDDYY